MPRKVRIQRKKRPWLYMETKRNFAFANAIWTLLNIFVAKPIVQMEKANLENVKAERLVVDTQLKAMRLSHVTAQTNRVDLLNAETRLKMEAEFGAGKVAKALGERYEDEFEQNIGQTYCGVDDV